MTTMLPPIFPLAPRAYDQDEERAFRSKVSLAVGDAMQNAAQNYMGIPNEQVTGTNAAFSIPVGSTPIILPFNSELVHAPSWTFNNVNFSLTNAFPMNTEMFFRIRHEATSGGSVDVLITLLINSVAAETYGYTARLDDVFDISDTFFPIANAGGLVAQLAMQHNHTQPVTVNMTKSKWALLQLTPTPGIV